MISVHGQLRARILAHAGVLPDLAGHPSFFNLVRSEWCPTFERLMRNRLLMGAYRYGPLRNNPRRTDNIGLIVRRARRYLEDGNQEHLVDIANLALVEFVRPGSHPNPCWQPQDDANEHALPIERRTR